MNRRNRKSIVLSAGDTSDNISVKLPPMEFPMQREWNVGRNDQCPCGSGLKYKKYETYVEIKNYKQ